jgi:hypothetical protein
MKKIVNLIVLLSAALLFASPVSVHASEIVQNFPLAIVPGVLGMAYGAYIHITKLFQTPFVFRAVEVEIWTEYIADNLFKGIEFLKNSFRADSYVLSGKVVHIPQPGSRPTVVKNRTSIPATAVKRNDTDVVYALDEYTTDPTVIEDAATVQLSYDKMTSVLGDHIGALNESVCDNILNSWAPAGAANIIRTSGSNYVSHMTGATGNRKGFTLSDLKRAKVTLDKQKVSAKGRYAVMSFDMWSQLEDELKATNAKDYSLYNDAKEGAIAKLYGFDIVPTTNVATYDSGAITASTWARSTTTATITTPAPHGLVTGTNVQLTVTSDAAAIPLGIYTITVTGASTFTFTCLNGGGASGTASHTANAAPVVRAIGALGAITDNDAVFCYQKDCVELALGEIKFFEQTNHPQMYGDVYSGLVRMGGRQRYTNGIGIVAIVQAQ